jgi:hypothetical protein
MKETNWNMASNAQLKEELERLDKLFNAKQKEMEKIVSEIDVLHNDMNNLSKSYVEIKHILNKREGKKQ